MLEVLYHYFERSFPLTEADKDLIKSLVFSRNIKKGEFLLRDGEMSKHGAFVAKGCLRSYMSTTKAKNILCNLQRKTGGSAIRPECPNARLQLFLLMLLKIQNYIMMDLAGHVTLLKKLPGYSDSFRAGIQRRAVAKDHRIISSLTASAEERYADFLETYPNIAQRVPQHMLASYLGVTPETVSRIRKQASLKK